ncbi:M15 family metallopeptidase [Crassaminicella profunda]|uniref:M15 family metallopeptidase n=1 Tax=Crassaminicella profunda TaxID=1286698 RepID=UPI001CA61E38|nr:M15 family metallopeptidase [Crassaminicella profunda]QZY54855.1 M15 family metallopeptidase [Crassaminicella profunda]
MKRLNGILKILMINVLVFFMMSSLTIAQEVEQKAFRAEKYSLEQTTYIENHGYIIQNVDDLLVLVNKNRNLPSNYVPKDLVVPKVCFPFKGKYPKKQMRKEAAFALEELFKAAENENIYIYALSGYRSYNRQKNIFNYKVRTIGKEVTTQISAYPGQSEHQTGLAMDVTSKSVRFRLVEGFENTKEGKWLKENCHQYGFIIRYPKEKEDITGYSYEPWHIRYVGKEGAAYIVANNITLEEFFEQFSKENRSASFIENSQEEVTINQEEYINNQKECITNQEELMMDMQKVQLLFFTIPF